MLYYYTGKNDVGYALSRGTLQDTLYKRQNYTFVRGVR